MEASEAASGEEAKCQVRKCRSVRDDNGEFSCLPGSRRLTEIGSQKEHFPYHVSSAHFHNALLCQGDVVD